MRKGGEPKRYRDALLKDKCAYLVKNTIAGFGLQHGVCRDALSSHVQGFLCRRLYEGDGQEPYYSSEDVESDDNEEGDNETDDEGSEDEEEPENYKDGDGDRGVPLYGRMSF